MVLQVANEGSLTGAARILQLTQPTVGRRLAAVEERLKRELFRRTSVGLTPTPMGKAILDDLHRMQDLAARIERQLASQDGALTGSVTISTTPWFGAHVITPLMSRFLAEHPGITAKIYAGAHEHSLTKREADIALRGRPFEQENLTQRKVGEITFGLYASRDYLARTGSPSFSDGGLGHRLLVLENDQSLSAHSQILAKLLPVAEIVWRTDNSESLLRAAEAGIGLAVLPVHQVEQNSSLIEVSPPHSFPTRPMWLGYHSELRKIQRVRKTVDFLAKNISSFAFHS